MDLCYYLHCCLCNKVSKRNYGFSLFISIKADIMDRFIIPGYHNISFISTITRFYGRTSQRTKISKSPPKVLEHLLAAKIK